MRVADREWGVASSAVVAFLVGVLAHRASLAYWFTGSDTVPMIESSRVVEGDLVAVFTEPMMAGTRFVEFARFYRPLSSLSYAFDYAIWGLDPTGYHVTSVLLHGVAAAAATVALVAVTRRRLAGLLGGVLFAGHPLTAEVVPSAIRRHDVLVTIFLLAALVLLVRSRRSANGRTPLTGSLACYTLALLSKEPALIFPGIVVAWVALDQERVWSTGTLSAATRAVAPFAAVTATYLAVRVAVLGGVGGYRRQPNATPADLVMILVEYPLSLAYPHAVVGMGTLPGAKISWRVVLAGMVGVGGLVLVLAGITVWRRQISVASLGAVATAGALVAVPLAIAFEGWLVHTIPVLYDPGRLTVLRVYLRPSSAIVGLLLASAVVTVVVWAAADRSSSLRPTDARTLAFFGVWLLGPIALFFPSGNYTFRSGYASLVPAMGAIGLILAVGVDGLREAVARIDGDYPWRGVGATDAALVGVALLVVVPLVATTPLVHHYDGWETTGLVNEATLTGVEAATDGAPPEADVEIAGMLRVLADRGCSFPRAKNLQFARPGTVEAWLRLHGEDRRVSSRDDRVLRGNPERVTVSTGRRDGNVTATVHYFGGEPDSCIRSTWWRYQSAVSPTPAVGH